LPNVYDGVSSEQLSEIYNLMDIYVQYACAEGFGIPMIEATACAIPFMATNYSAMESIVRMLQGIPIDVYKYYREPESHSYRVYPSNDDFIQKLHKFLSMPEQLRIKMGRDSYNLCKQHFNWDTVAEKWIKAIDQTPKAKLEWNCPPRFHTPNMNIPPNMNNADFVRWCFINILGDPSKLNTYLESKYLRNLNYGASIDGYGGLHTSELSDPAFSPKYPPFNHQRLVQLLQEYCQRRNYCEKLRVSYRPEMAPDYIKMARSNYCKK
jgi:hypothetical protein